MYGRSGFGNCLNEPRGNPSHLTLAPAHTSVDSRGCHVGVLSVDRDDVLDQGEVSSDPRSSIVLSVSAIILDRVTHLITDTVDPNLAGKLLDLLF